MENFNITRRFNASKATVFQAFAQPEAMAAWWGPVGMPATVLAFEFQPEGRFHYKLENNGQIMWGLFVYKKIIPAETIIYVSSFSDENGNICKAPFPIDFPMQVYNELTFEEDRGVTTLTLKAHPLHATEAQEVAFTELTESMQNGYGGTLNQLETYLNQLKK